LSCYSGGGPVNFLIMKSSKDSSSEGFLTRRHFLKSSALAATGAALSTVTLPAAANKNSKLRIFHIGVGGIGGLQRSKLKNHKKVEFVGLCDVDSNTLNKIGNEFPKAFKVADYREAFEKRSGEFDAVIVDTPDHHHAPMMLTAMQHNKHIYGQKPLVHQLDELRMIREGLAARPYVVTQMGNQRSAIEGRQQAVEILRSNQLGRPVESHVWTGEVKRGHYFVDPWSELPKGKPVPKELSWDLWNGPLQDELAYSDDLAPRRWRAFWDTGGGQLADWGCHLLDLLYFAYDLPSPTAVQTNTIRPSNTGHSAYNQSTITYPGGKNFARDKFLLHYNDSGITPSFASLGLPPMKVGANRTMVVCEEGTLLLEANGGMQILRKGKEIKDEPRPKVAPRDHWHDWVDNCLGDKKPLWAPFQIGVRITEPALLAVKATRFPGQELRWDASKHQFTNHDEANKTILKRNYRKGFEPPKVGPAAV
jgi:predicted dehydrogenase